MTVERPEPASSPDAVENSGLFNMTFVMDKLIDFVLIFVGLYAATAVQRYQDDQTEKAEYVALLGDFARELSANRDQEKSIEKDLGPIDQTTPGKNLGPIEVVFDAFFEQLDKDEKVAHCLHVEFASSVAGSTSQPPSAECHALYKKFEGAHQGQEKHFDFKPAVLTPFYRYEVWELYLVSGVRTFRNKELAVKIGEIYNNARLIERQVADIEATYNDSFMTQVGRSAATDMELSEVVHDEETQHGLSPQNQQALIQISHDIKAEHYSTVETRSILSLKVERMKKTVLLLRSEIDVVSRALEAEIKRH